jgi:inhibitor of KinA
VAPDRNPLRAETRWASDHGLLVSFEAGSGDEARARVLRAIAALERAGIRGLRNIHPAYASVLAVCDPLAIVAAEFERAVLHAIESGNLGGQPTRPVVEIPVCYARPHAPDLDELAARHGLPPGEVVRLHSSADYVVCFLGFVPGFPYLAGLPDVLATPRLAVPRKKVPAGSVAIGGAQAGIYPFATPGGWRLIGRTPLHLFQVERDPPALLSAGDRVRFVPIAEEEFSTLPRRAP